ncbi:hypothetical protein ACFC6L_12550 [Kitasatospora phosalacinea]|uniref:hypothetical protein n=1 Tax=Kitasatospora phosalacinea TaxID=2065 RepID=UPI0035D764B2
MDDCRGVRPIPSAADLIGREAREGREAVVQRALSSLMLGHEPCRWNEPHTPTLRGARFVALLDEAAFGATHPGTVRLVDEFELPSRDGVERAGWPDFAVLWDDRILMIELKAEASSHTRGQCERYLALAGHHHPRRRVDLLYLTPQMPVVRVADLSVNCGFAHMTWSAALPHIAEVWAGSIVPEERELATFLADYLPALERRVGHGRRHPKPARDAQRAPAGHASPRPAEAGESATAAAILAAAALVQRDGEQRGVELDCSDLSTLEAVRTLARDLLCGGPHDGDTRGVLLQPWIWRAATSTGQPLTEAGRNHGFELRLSRRRMLPEDGGTLEQGGC